MERGNLHVPFIILALLLAIPIAANCQNAQQITRGVFIVEVDNINYEAIAATREENRMRDESYSKKREELLQQKLIRDRKIELDAQLTLDTARIQNKSIDTEKIEKEKATKLQESQKRYDIDMAAAMQRASHYEYRPPKEDIRYSITFFDKRFSINTWYEVFVEKKGEIMPFEGSSFEPSMQKITKIGDGYIIIEMFSPMLRDGTSQRKIELPIGVRFIIYTVQFE